MRGNPDDKLVFHVYMTVPERRRCIPLGCIDGSFYIKCLTTTPLLSKSKAKAREAFGWDGSGMKKERTQSDHALVFGVHTYMQSHTQNVSTLNVGVTKHS